MRSPSSAQAATSTLLTLLVGGITDMEGCITRRGMLISPVHLCGDAQVWVISSVYVDYVL